MMFPIAKRIAILGGLPEINKLCPAITPTLGAELCTNPGLEGVYIAGLAPNWLKSGSPTISESADAHGGSSAQQFTAAASGNNIQQAVTVANKAWHLLTCWGKRTAGSNSDAAIGINNGATDYAGLPYQSASYAQAALSFRSWATTVYPRPVRSILSAFDTVIVDDVSLKALTFASCITFLGKRGQKNGTYICHPTITGQTCTGIIIEYLDANNFVIAYQTRGRAFLEVCSGGVWTTKIDLSLTYAAAAELRVIVNGTSHSLYYNGLQVGTTQTIDNIGMGLDVYGFNTYSGNTVGLVRTSKVMT